MTDRKKHTIMMEPAAATQAMSSLQEYHPIEGTTTPEGFVPVQVIATDSEREEIDEWLSDFYATEEN